MTKPAPSQERSRRRREALLRAAIAVLAESGAKAVTHRAVAARAGLPPATTTYYFDSIQQLTREALELHVGERVSELRELAATIGTGDSVEAIAREFAEALTLRSRDALIAMYEVYLEAGREPALAETVAEALTAFETLAAEILAALGARRPTEAAEAFVAMLDGFALHRASRPRSVARDADGLFEAMRGLFIAYAMDPDELSRWHTAIAEPIALAPGVSPSDVAAS